MSMKSKLKRSSITRIMFVSLLAVGIAVASFGAAQAAYPDRPITIIVPWGAGGGTDAVGRIFANLLEQDLGVPVNVVNRTGGSGVVGHSAIINAKPDGYTIGIATVEVVMMHWVGLTELTYADFTVFGQVNLDPGGLMVAADSPYKSAKDLLDDARSVASDLSVVAERLESLASLLPNDDFHPTIERRMHWAQRCAAARRPGYGKLRLS